MLCINSKSNADIRKEPNAFLPPILNTELPKPWCTGSIVPRHPTLVVRTETGV